MFSKVEPFLLHSLSSVHAGSGSEVGIVDLPIQRESHTGYPKIESSTLKGALRMTVTDIADLHENRQQLLEKVSLVFGASPKESSNENLASAIGLADARILFFPVKSLRGVFAWVTSPYALNRFVNELKLYGSNLLEGLKIPQEPSVSSDKLFIRDNKIVLEEYTFELNESEKLKQVAETLQGKLFQGFDSDFAERVVLLNDNDFLDFVKLSTEVNTRINIDPITGTVKPGALWNEENVPPETIFYSFLFASHVRKINDLDDLKTADDVTSFLKNPEILPNVFQLGGNSTLGRGMLRIIWL
ncbi:type III-B CRISPR module RAMP protein Cmr4 [Ureibacillus thermosphaericus]|uniref:CRISPR-associated protein Cmr4 n=1 Tax=Ureibacillus thermosphaericus TaxID=51173 RepID=A0A840Q214_URETH|nr:type III-B CRISPR module RAMP protein Cmr4 [Ureibacillus thermosphaericus]MBB5149086.1 CRISPR-associated protein Cmr4 [Ureibacillus thermosphaericus]NKZ31850.1 type III-B CRISPR module RAMP protein Cmr4 [Ureibacillus thermosphaericus]